MAEAVVRITAQNDTAAAFRDVLQGATSLGDSLKTVFETAFVGLSANAIWDNIKGAIDYGDAVGKAAEKAGVATEAFSQLAYAAKLNDVSFEELSKAFKGMQVAIAGGSDAFAQIGIPLEKLRDLKPDQQFDAIAEAISRLKDPAERTSAAVAIFGRAGADLLPLLTQGAAGIETMRKQADDLGLTLGGDAVQKMEDAKQAIDRMDSSFGRLWQTVATKASPTLSTFFDSLRIALGGGSEIENLKDRLAELRQQRDALLDMGTFRQLTPAENGNLNRIYDQVLDLQKKIASLSTGSTGASIAEAIVGTPQNAAARTQATFSSINATARAQMEKLRATIAGINLWADQAAAQQRALDAADTATQTSVEKQLAMWQTFEADLATLRQAGVIDAQEANKRQAEELDKLLPVFETSVKDVKVEHMKSLDDMSEYAKRAAQNMQDAFANFLFDPFKDGAKGMLIDFVNMIRQMIAQAAAADIFKALGMDKGSSGGGWLGKLLGAVVGSASGSSGGDSGAGVGGADDPTWMPFATGGAFTVGGTGGTDSQRVRLKVTPGERVTVTRPDQSNAVVNNFNYSIDARGATTDLVRALPEILKRNNESVKAQIIDGMRRRTIRV